MNHIQQVEEADQEWIAKCQLKRHLNASWFQPPNKDVGHTTKMSTMLPQIE